MRLRDIKSTISQRDSDALSRLVGVRRSKKSISPHKSLIEDLSVHQCIQDDLIHARKLVEEIFERPALPRLEHRRSAHLWVVEGLEEIERDTYRLSRPPAHLRKYSYSTYISAEDDYRGYVRQRLDELKDLVDWHHRNAADEPSIIQRNFLDSLNELASKINYLRRLIEICHEYYFET